MASALRIKAPLRTIQSFTATPSKLPALVPSRNLHMTGSREASPALTSFERSMAEIPARAKSSSSSTSTRTFNTSRSHKSVRDTSTVDFAYFPETVSFANPSSATELPQIPLLPDNYTAKASPAHVAAPEPAVHMPEISTPSLGSAISAFGEAEQSRAADMIGLVEEKVKGEVGGVRRVLGDMWEDLLGGAAVRKPAVV